MAHTKGRQRRCHRCDLFDAIEVLRFAVAEEVAPIHTGGNQHPSAVHRGCKIPRRVAILHSVGVMRWTGRSERRRPTVFPPPSPRYPSPSSGKRRPASSFAGSHRARLRRGNRSANTRRIGSTLPPGAGGRVSLSSCFPHEVDSITASLRSGICSRRRACSPNRNDGPRRHPDRRNKVPARQASCAHRHPFPRMRRRPCRQK